MSVVQCVFSVRRSIDNNGSGGVHTHVPSSSIKHSCTLKKCFSFKHLRHAVQGMLEPTGVREFHACPSFGLCRSERR